jgi:hypothetical protein
MQGVWSKMILIVWVIYKKTAENNLINTLKIKKRKLKRIEVKLLYNSIVYN